MRSLWLACLWLTVAVAARPASLDTARAEPNFEKRSRLALDNADAAYLRSRADFDAGKLEAAAADLREVQQSVELAKEALDQTRQNPSRKPKNFKYAETRTRDLLRKLKGWQESVDSSDRPMIEAVRNRIQEVHDEWLTGIMGKKR